MGTDVSEIGQRSVPRAVLIGTPLGVSKDFERRACACVAQSFYTLCRARTGSGTTDIGTTTRDGPAQIQADRET